MAAERRRTVKVRSERTKKRNTLVFFVHVAITGGGFRNFLIDNTKDTTNSGRNDAAVVLDVFE